MEVETSKPSRSFISYSSEDNIKSFGVILKKHLHLFLFTLVFIYFSRLPFLMAGYGNDPDAWRVADTARRIASENKYSASRLPGFPVQEIICSFLWTGGPFALNSVTALFSALSVSFFSFIMKFYGSRDYVLGSFAFAFTPVIYINSTNSMDYLWALAFILGSFYFVLIRKPLVAGLFLGIAIGCRVTSVAMFVPLFLLLISQEPNDFNHRDRLTFFLGTFFVSIFVYLPVFLRY